MFQISSFLNCYKRFYIYFDPIRNIRLYGYRFRVFNMLQKYVNARPNIFPYVVLLHVIEQIVKPSRAQNCSRVPLWKNCT